MFLFLISSFRCYQICSMPWYLRKMASMVFSAPPTSSFEEALQYFLKAEEAEPKFYRFLST